MSENENENGKVTTFELMKQDNAALRWLKKAALSLKDGSRPVLQCVNFTKTAMITVDDFRLHAAKRNGLGGDDADGLYRFDKIPTGAELVRAEKDDGVFPAVEQCVPKGEPDAAFYVNPQYLIEALEGMRNAPDGIVKIAVRTQRHEPVEVFGYDAHGSPLYAVIMPMDTDMVDAGKYTWRFTTVEREEATE